MSFNLATCLATLQKRLGFELVLLASPATSACAAEVPGARVLTSASRFFSREDIIDLPSTLSGQIDAFWSTQFYVSPFFHCPVVTMIHDLWPVRCPEWLPNHDEVRVRHGTDVMDAAREMVDYFESSYLKRLGVQATTAYRADGPLFDRFMFAMMVLAAHSARIVLTCSSYSEQNIASFLPFCADKLRLVYPYVRGRALPRRPRLPSIDRVLMVAKWDPRKNHAFAIEALAELFRRRSNGARVEAHFVGEIGYRSFGRSLKQRALDMAVGRHGFFFHDTADEADLWDWYASCNLLLMPSLDEGFGLPLLEALEAGLPALASRRGSLPEVGQHFVAYTNLASPGELAQELDEVLNHQPSALERALEGQRNVGDRFSFARSVAQVESVVRALMDR